MKTIRNLSRLADRILGFALGILAFILIVYGCYFIYDNIYTGQSAFISRDLLQYKPKITSDENKPPDFENLTEINSDVVGWVTIYNTNINYPVLLGEDDYEYLNKDVYGNSTLSGSIYLSSLNNGDFTDYYNIIYGHHMKNGAMFGDIDKYVDKDYFLSHRKGELITKTQVYDVNIFACVRTQAFEDMVYSVGKTKADEKKLLEFIKENSEQYVESDTQNLLQIIAFSTCADAETYGRLVLFADITPRDKSTVTETEDETVPAISKNVVQGHNVSKDRWALLNLICVLITAMILLPFGFIFRKYRQFPYARKTANELDKISELLKEYLDRRNKEEEENADEEHFPEDHKEDNMTNDDENDDNDFDPSEELNPEEISDEIDHLDDIVHDLRFFQKKMIFGFIFEIIILIIAVIVFLLTENIFTPMTIRDEWTFLMIVISCVAWILDFILFRYRGKLPPQEDDEEDKDQNQDTADESENISAET